MGKFQGSYEATGYIALARKVIGKAVRDADGTLLGYDLDEERSGLNGDEIYIFRSESMPAKYDTTSCDDTWHMVQYSGDSALFKTAGEAELAFDRYLRESNDWVKNGCKFATHPPFRKEDLFVRVVKVHYSVGMEEVGG